MHLIVTLLDEKTHHRDTMLLLYVSVYAASAVFIFHDIFITFVCGLEFVFFSLWIFPFFFGVSVFHEMSTHSKPLCVSTYWDVITATPCMSNVMLSWLLLVIYVKIYSDKPKRPQKLLTFKVCVMLNITLLSVFVHLLKKFLPHCWLCMCICM